MQTKAANMPSKYASGWLADLDGRYNLAKDMRGRYSEVCGDLGGETALSYMQRSLIERSLWLEYWLADQERALSKGGEFDVNRWIQACNSLQGVYSRLGLERRARDVPDLRTYLASRTNSEVSA